MQVSNLASYFSLQTQSRLCCLFEKQLADAIPEHTEDRFQRFAEDLPHAFRGIADLFLAHAPAQVRVDHAALGSQVAVRLLEQEGLGDETWRQRVARCIRTHRFRNRTGESPQTVEERVLFDADKLDSLGAVGLARAFHFAGKTGARVHNTAREALEGESYGREDSAYREYLVKLRKLPQAMLTRAGREAAEKRLAFMADFFQELDRECFPE